MIDGASVRASSSRSWVPIMKPSIVSVAILEAMWIWNDYLLPYLTLDLGKYQDHLRTQCSTSRAATALWIWAL